MDVDRLRSGPERSSGLRLAGVLASAVALASCVTPAPAMQRPAGFALFEGERYRAVSPEGVTVGVRLVANDPQQDLAFWAEALKVHLLKAGYRLLAEERFKAPLGEGSLLEWVAPVAGQDWVYLTALAIHGSDIALVEAAGPFRHYREHRGALLAILATLNVPEKR